MLIPLLLLFYGVGNISGSTLPDNSTDMLSLLGFKEAITNDPSGVLSNWNTSIHLCSWNGVWCSPKHPGRVTALNLAGQGLSGTISSSVGNLTFVRTLDLSNNNFSGQMPHLANLQKMQVLNLSFNTLDGIIPNTLTNCSNMRKLDLYTNLLEGAIPPPIGRLRNLVYIDLSRNNLTGIIPASLKNISLLETIYLQRNQLEGSIPDELGQFSNISLMALGANRLSGNIPASLFNLSSLRILELRANLLGGILPSNMGNHLTNLQHLFMGQNMFKGHVPASLGNASMLETIVLQSNNFTGRIPTSLGKLSNLYKLDLELNMLEAKDTEGWKFLDALTNCTALEVLALAENQLQGVIPNSIGSLSNTLRYLVLGGNELSGIVPSCIGNLSGLIQLSLDVNKLTGSISPWIGNLKYLEYLNLGKNRFTGPIPYSIGSLTRLTELYLEKNAFEGHIPPSLGNPPLLLKLDLTYNNLQGTIPWEISNLRQLVYLKLTSNKLTGNIPNALDRCQNLVTIQMDQNFLTGTIPISLGNLKGLSVLNLSHNILSGTIPAVLGDLPLLSKLDLSYNNLQGEIPRIELFRTSVYLEGNRGLCGGVMDLHMPSCPQVSHRKERKSNLTRLLIPIVGFLSLTVLICLIYLVKKTPRRTYLSLLSFGKQFPRVSYKDIAQATGNFSQSNLIGRGSYGSVYKAKLTPVKIQVAIKVFDLEMRWADKSFVSECEILRSIRHRNLLPILTACSTIDYSGNDFKALIYEYMPNGNLDMWLHKKNTAVASKCLSLSQRVNIAVDIANALSYLHHECERSIIHCDLKPMNILLDSDMNAYLGDFGISSLVLESKFASLGHSCPNSLIGLKGTIGYIAPECGNASTYGDVYGFGIVLLEMLTGKRPTDPMFENELNIVNFMEKNFPEQIPHIIDAQLQEECKGFNQERIGQENRFYKCLLSVVQVALSCTHPIPRERMDIREIAIKLQAIRTSYAEATKRDDMLRRRELQCTIELV
ncbi:receptor kinase-like protein Xa21 isoform X2 [Oryza sativa Japonica Group]|uniref:receptor kinase-like protein Xa21 isoform X2 n=1 Tax=Oryza sativa subsp. japonica TaxID=39947 RepID=UPI00077536A9|nr:receptor kinase-like protein Xa21 isoform X2 [Oryza sativa Japonica Group]